MLGVNWKKQSGQDLGCSFVPMQMLLTRLVLPPVTGQVPPPSTMEPTGKVLPNMQKTAVLPRASQGVTISSIQESVKLPVLEEFGDHSIIAHLMLFSDVSRR